jgi:predicted hotdog family 3-hydroxylacyl-ACP dehydratase
MRPVYVHGVGLFGPGFPDIRAWFDGRRVDGATAPRDVLPVRARRGTTLVMRILCDVVAQATEQSGFDVATVRTVYASAYGETATSAVLLSMIYESDGALSPARFSTSVHNAASGLVSIAGGNRAFSTAIAAGPQTVAMGLLEAMTLIHADPSPVVVAFADEPVPAVLSPVLGFEPLGVAFGLSGDPRGALATLIDVRRAPRAATPAPCPGYEKNPAAAALPLVRAVFEAGARGGSLTPPTRDGRAVVALELEGDAPWSALVTPPAAAHARPPPVEELVPHRPPMLLIDEVVAWDDAGAECRVVLRDDSPFVEAGRVSPMLAIEYMAQCVAVYAGLRGRERGQPVRVGYLVGAREVVLGQEPFRVGDVLRVRARHAWGDEILGSFQCSVERGDEVVAQGTLNVYGGDLDVSKHS